MSSEPGNAAFFLLNLIPETAKGKLAVVRGAIERKVPVIEAEAVAAYREALADQVEGLPTVGGEDEMLRTVCVSRAAILRLLTDGAEELLDT